MDVFMDHQLVSAKEVERYAFKNEYVIIDIRSAREFRERHIKGAVCIPYERLLKTINAGDRNRTGTGGKSRRILSPVRLPVPPRRHLPYVNSHKKWDLQGSNL